MHTFTPDLKAYLYISTKNPKFFSDAVHLMLLSARKDNLIRGITGCLIFYRGYFIQYFEGYAPITDILYNSILQDGRHSEMTELKSGRIKSRMFPKFMMDFHELDGNSGIIRARFDLLQGFLRGARVTPDNEVFYQALLKAVQLLLDKQTDPYSKLPGLQDSKEVVDVSDLLID